MTPAIAVFAAAMALSIGAANAAPITGLSALGADDSIGWAAVGKRRHIYVRPQRVVSVGHLHATVSSGGSVPAGQLRCRRWLFVCLDPRNVTIKGRGPIDER